MTISKNNKELELKKHVAIIHCNGKITLLQRKIANALLFHAYKNLLTYEEHVIQISELAKMVGFDSNDHKKIKEALLKLLSTVIEWNVIDELSDGNEMWNASSIISDVSINGSICRYSYSNRMRELLYHPVRYGKIDLNIQTKFQSSYGLTLYENCNRYQSIGNTPWMDLERFRKLMGVEQGLYKVFRDLNNRVIRKGVEEVNQYTPMFIEPEFKKINRQVVSLRFVIKNKKQIHTAYDHEQGFTLIDNLSEIFGLSKRQIEETLKKYDIEFIQNKMNLVINSESYNKGTIRSLARYLMAALADDYKLMKPAKSEMIVKFNNDKFSFDNHKKYNKFLRKYVEEQYKKTSEEDQKLIYLKFKDEIKNTGYISLLEKFGMDNSLIQDKFFIFIKKMMPEDAIPSIESYLEDMDHLK